MKLLYIFQCSWNSYSSGSHWYWC